MGNVMEGVAETKALLDRFDEVSAKFAEPLDDDEMNALHGRAGPNCRRRSTPATAGSCSARSTSPWTRCAARRAMPTSPRSRAASGGGWRCAGCCCPSPTCCCSTSRPTIWTPNRWPGSSGSSRTTRAPSWPITHDRYFLDNVAGWILELDRGRGIPYQGNYTGWLEQKRKRLEQEEREDQARAAHAGPRGGVDRPEPAGPPRQVQGAHHRLRGAAGRSRATGRRAAPRSSSRRARGWATW